MIPKGLLTLCCKSSSILCGLYVHSLFAPSTKFFLSHTNSSMLNPSGTSTEVNSEFVFELASDAC